MSSRVQTNCSRLFFCAIALLVAHTLYGQSPAQSGSFHSTLTQAKSQFAKHDLKSAEESIWKVLSADPNNVDALFLLGTLRAQQQRYSEAETLFQRVVQLKPSDAAARVELGQTYLTENKLAEATEQYKSAEQLAPHNVDVHVTLARLYTSNGDFASALASLESIPAARFPVEAIPVRVGCLLALGRENEAINQADKVKLPSLDLALAEVFVTSKLPQEALKLLSAAAASGKNRPARFYFVKAKALDQSGDQAAAVENFHKAIALEPNSEEFLLATAELYSREGKHNDALKVLQTAYKVDPTSPKVLRPLILEASFAHKTSDVQEAAERLAANSEEAQDLFIAADVFLLNARQDAAVPLLEKYLQKNPDDGRAWVGVGMGYEDMKRFDDAQKAFERALKADPKLADAEYQLGVLISLNGNTAAAAEHFQNAIQINPNHAPSLEQLGNYYLESGQFDKARDALLRSEALDPQNRKVEYGLALAFSKLGNRDEAKIHMEKFERAGPIGSTETKQ